MREPTEDQIAADFARYQPPVRPILRKTSDYALVAQCCIGLFLIVLGCIAAIALALELGWQP